MTKTYDVYRDGTRIASGLIVPSYVDSGLVNGVAHSYQVSAVVNGIESALSAIVSATPIAAPVRPWPLPVTTGTFNVSVDKTGATDVTSALNAFIATVPDGSIISFPYGTYKISSNIDLRGRNNLIFEGNGSTLNNTVDANVGNSQFDSFFTTQFPGYSGAITTHVTIRNFNCTGANPTPGQLPTGEYAAILGAYSGTYFELDNVTGTGIFGDLLTANEAADFLYVHNCHIVNTGRNGISIVWASDLLAEDNAFDTCGWSIFDVEPETASAGYTIANLTFRNNTAGVWNSSTGFFFATNGNGTTYINDVTVTGNTITTSSLQTICNVAATARRTNIIFSNNTALSTGTIKQAEDAMLSFAHIDGLTVQHNTQPLTSGALVSDTDCTSAVVTPNP